MKKLILLSLVIIYSNIIGYSMEEQLCSAVNNCDVEKTKDLINKVGKVNSELKLILIKSAQNNIEHYQNASKFILLSPHDSINFAFSGAVLAGSLKIIDFFCKNRSSQITVRMLFNFVKKTFKYFNIKREQSPIPYSFNDIENSINMQTDPVKKVQHVIQILAISAATVVSLISIYKIINTINCKSALNKLQQSQVVYSLVSEIKVKEIKPEN